jgi:DNA invertase Pin-like site-specific DNA recombinase
MIKSTTPESEALILELYSLGKTIAEIATVTNLNRSVVAQLLLVRCPETRTEAKTALIEKIKAAGIDPSLSLTANAKRHGTDVLTIKAVFWDLGLVSKPEPKKKGLTKPERAERIMELRRSGLTYRAIGKEVGISHERVRKILQRYGSS